MAKTLCKWKKKDIEKNPNELFKLIERPKYYCKECARSANNKNVLCKPTTLK